MSKSYFSKLNYTLANEDTSLELGIVERIKPRTSLTVCGSGGRALPLLKGTSDALVLCDLSPDQLLLAKLRLQVIKSVSFRDFLLFFGFPPYDASENRPMRRTIFERLDLDHATRQYFTEHFGACDYESILYHGKWERTFVSVPKLVRRFVGSRYDEVFSFTDLESQRRYFDQVLSQNKWLFVPRLVLKAFGNAAFFNTVLYKGHFAKKNVPQSHYDYYRTGYRKLFFQGLCRENFFLQLTFLGRLIYPEGNPTEAMEPVFDAMKQKAGSVKIEFVNQDLLSFGEGSPEKFDFVSLSDVPSYFSNTVEKNYLQRLARALNKDALVVVRCYLRIPEGTDLAGYDDVTEEFTDLVQAEKTQLYYTFIYRYRG